MFAFFRILLGKIVAFVTWIGELAKAVFVALWDMAKDAICWPFEQFLNIVIGALGEIDTSALTGNLQGWGSLPSEVLNVLGLLGVGTAITIIGAAITIRLLLQLIPFVRLGS